MNLPNKLTTLRVLLVPVFVCLLLAEGGGRQDLRLLAAAVFCGAALTDFLDGQIARRFHMVTNFGKFMDPLADKLLVCSALICLVELSQLPAWYAILVIAREFVISGFRLVASDNGIVIAASWWGKWKTAFQMAAVILLVLNIPALIPAAYAIAYIALFLTVLSLADYLWKNRQVLTAGGM